MLPAAGVPDAVVLRGHGVRLEPLDEARHRDGLAAAIADGALWSIPVTFVPRVEELPAFFADADQSLREGRGLAFATIDAEADRVVGSTRFRPIELTQRRVEIGFTFLAATYQRTHVNTAAKLLMLRHAFDTWQVNRVEFLTDVLNAPSRAAIARLGAHEEGVLRSHMVMSDGRVRDSAISSIIRSEWPGVSAQLEARLAQA
jgi:RimJ/RimL family protein N-acetyltransferase